MRIIKRLRISESDAAFTIRKVEPGDRFLLTDDGSLEARDHTGAALRGKGTRWVAINRLGEAVGAACAEVSNPPQLKGSSPVPPSVLHLSAIGSLCGGAGIGTALLDEVKQEATELNIPIWLNPTLLSVGFYLQLGFNAHEGMMVWNPDRQLS